jgi:hypothetical protein
VAAYGPHALRVAYKVLPIQPNDPQFKGKNCTWMPILSVGLIIGHSPTKKFEAIIDSGSPICLFHASMATAHGMKLADGEVGTLCGVVGGASGQVYYHNVKLCVGADIIKIRAGFSDAIPVAGLLGRHGFFEHFSVLFDPSETPPGLTITRIGRA